MSYFCRLWVLRASWIQLYNCIQQGQGNLIIYECPKGPTRENQLCIQEVSSGFRTAPTPLSAWTGSNKTVKAFVESSVFRA